MPAATLRSTRASGVFVHEVLERVPLASFGDALDAWRARADVAALFDEAMAVHRVDPAQREHAERLVWGAYTTPIALPGGGSLARLASASRVVREMDFVFPVAASPHARQSADSSTPGGKGAPRAYVRGSLDLAFEHAGKTYFVDWKTDSLAAYDAASLGQHVEGHYEDQVRFYALAVEKLLGVRSREEHDARFGGILYCFLRGLDGQGAGLWSARPGWDEVARWDEELRARKLDARSAGSQEFGPDHRGRSAGSQEFGPDHRRGAS